MERPIGGPVVTRPGDPIDSLAQAVQRLHRVRNSKTVHTALMSAARVELTQQSLAILMAVSGGESATEIAAAAQMDPAAVSRELARMERSGLIERPVPPRRVPVEVQLTTEGRRIQAQVSAVRNDHLERALADWDVADVKKLARLLDRFVDDLHARPLERRE